MWESDHARVRDAAAYAIWELAVPIAVRWNVTELRFIPSTGFMASFQELSIQSH